MKLNSNFDSKLESTINLFEPLANWFERNQNDLVYLGLTSSECSIEDYPYAPMDAKVLGRMAHMGLIWLEKPDDMITPEDKAYQAALAIANVYEKEQEKLSEYAKVCYYLNVEELQKDHSQEKVRSLKVEQQ